MEYQGKSCEFPGSISLKCIHQSSLSGSNEICARDSRSAQPGGDKLSLAAVGIHAQRLLGSVQGFENSERAGFDPGACFGDWGHRCILILAAQIAISANTSGEGHADGAGP
jgi:hypothetical protein